MTLHDWIAFAIGYPLAMGLIRLAVHLRAKRKRRE